MKKTLSLLLTLSLSVFANVQLTKKELGEFKKFPLISAANIELRSGEKIEGNLYHLEGIQNKSKISLFTDKKTIIVGQGFNIETGTEYKFPIKLDDVKAKEAFTVGTGKDEYYLFTDPECPFCKQYDKLLPLIKDNFKMHIILYPLSIHLASEGMSEYIYSMPKNKRYETMQRLMHQPLYKSLKELGSFNWKLYENLAYMIKMKRLRGGERNPYIVAINKAFNANIKLSSQDTQKAIEYLNEKANEMKKSYNKKPFNLLEDAKKTAEIEFNVNQLSQFGTPSVFDSKGKRIKKTNSIFENYGIVNTNKIKELAKSDFAFSAGEGKEKISIVTSTQCPHCRKMFQDKNNIDKLLKKYTITFILIPTGKDPQKAFFEMADILKLKKKDRFKRMVEYMTDKKVAPKYKSTDRSFDMKIAKYMRYDLRETLIQGTPTIIDENGKELNNLL